ncbi:MAG: glycosyltransferase [Dermatophilaceae bacterium]
MDREPSPPHLVSVVVPVYQGVRTLPGLVAELAASVSERTTPAGRRYRVTEVFLVDDCGPDGSDAVIRELARTHEWVRPVWLSRNFGQHAATLAGVAASGGEWVVTMDEDGQHDPERIADLIDVAMDEQADVVYARPSNVPPHGALRNIASRGAKWVVSRLANDARAGDFFSYRLVLGEVGRSVAAYAGPGIYLDVAIAWVARRVATCPMKMRAESGRPSGYRLRGLLSHFWRLVLSSGTTPLRWVSATGAAAVLLAPLVAAALVIGRAADWWEVPGWTSTMLLLMAATGVILFSLGVIAEYVGMAVDMAMGKPLYLPVRDRLDGPLGRESAQPAAGSGSSPQRQPAHRSGGG